MLKSYAALVLCILQMQTLVLAAGPKNLALHRSLNYAPKPADTAVVSSLDPLKLTDGVIGKSLWDEAYREKTVGWAGAKLVEITIDLGQLCNVGYVNLYTSGGGSDVEYLEYVVATSSRDGSRYSFAGYASSDGWSFGAGHAAPQVLKVTVEQKARYVKLYVRPIGYYFFTDEIEVIESQAAAVDSPSEYLGKEQTIELVERARQLQRELELLETRIDESPAAKNTYKSELSRVQNAVNGLSSKITSIGVSDVESTFSAFRRKVLHSQYDTDWLVYQTEPMAVLRYGDMPARTPKDVPISLYQWQNEHGVAALDLVNCSNSQITFKVSLSPLASQGMVVDSADIFELRRAVFVPVQNVGLVADPLVLQNAKPFPVAPGETVQLWLGTYSKGLKSGAYTAAMAVDASGTNITKTRQTIPIQLDVADKTFPETLSFSSWSWDYATVWDRFTSRNPECVRQAVTDLDNHYENVFTIRLDTVYVDDTSSLSVPKLRAELDLRSGKRPFFLLALGGRRELERRFGTLRTPAWESNFKAYLVVLRDSMLSSGFAYDSFAVFPFDEYIGDDFVYVAQVIRDCDPRLKIYANHWIDSDSQFASVRNLIDIWCPHLPQVISSRSTFDKYKATGAFGKIWCYYANIPRGYFFSPEIMTIGKLWRGGPNATAFRSMPIVAASLGMTGAGFWAYQDANKAGWTEGTEGDHGVVYDGTLCPDRNCISELIVPSKRWQQWREGIEDAVCLTGHKDLLDEFFQTPNSKLTSDYLTSLRKRADGIAR